MARTQEERKDGQRGKRASATSRSLSDVLQQRTDTCEVTCCCCVTSISMLRPSWFCSRSLTFSFFQPQAHISSSLCLLLLPPPPPSSSSLIRSSIFKPVSRVAVSRVVNRQLSSHWLLLGLLKPMPACDWWSRRGSGHAGSVSTWRQENIWFIGPLG